MSKAAQNNGIDWTSALRTNQKWLRVVVASRVGEQQAVDEVMQEIAVAAVESKSPPNQSKISPWLYQVAIRQAMLYRRRAGRDRKKTQNYALALRPCDADPHAPDPLQWLIDTERGQRIRKELDRLPQRDREILLLKYSDEWNYRKIAARLGTSPSAIESRLYRARKRLRHVLIQAALIEKT